MAVGVAVCTCKKCGAKFERKKTCRNRREADSWAEWASENFDLCPACYAAEMREKEAAEPLTLHFHLVPWLSKFCLTWESGPIIAHKDEIKSLGYMFREPDVMTHYSDLDMRNILNPIRRWTKNIPFSDLKKELDAARAMGAVIVNDIQNVERVYFRTLREKALECDKLISELPKPEKPGCYPQGRWNGKVYGGSRNGYSIYIDGEKKSVSEEDKELLEKYASEVDSYLNQVAEIKKTYEAEQTRCAAAYSASNLLKL